MELQDKINQEFKKALLDKDQTKVDVLRQIKNEIKNRQIEKGEELSESDIYQVLNRLKKQHLESISMYQQGGRPELAAKEETELKIIQSFLPAELGEEELKQIIQKAIQESGASSLKDLGKVMGRVMPQVKGRADGRKVQEIVRQLLSN